MKRLLTIAGLAALAAAPALAQNPAQTSGQTDPHRTTQYLEAHSYVSNADTKLSRSTNADFGGMPYQSIETRRRLAREKAARDAAAQSQNGATPAPPSSPRQGPQS
jgi:hypothetical protein